MSTVTTASATREHRVTVRSLAARKQKAYPFTMLTAYDFTFARIFDEAGVDVLLVGDSMGNVVQGHDTTLPVTLDEVTYHTRMVARGVRRLHRHQPPRRAAAAAFAAAPRAAHPIETVISRLAAMAPIEPDRLHSRDGEFASLLVWVDVQRRGGVWGRYCGMEASSTILRSCQAPKHQLTV